MRKLLLSVAIAVLCTSTSATVEARGGGGPRGGGGGAGPRGNFGGEGRNFRGEGPGNDFRGSEFRNGAELGNRGFENGIGRDVTPRSQVIHPEADAGRAPTRDNLQRFLGLPAGGEAAGRAAGQVANGRPNKAVTAQRAAQRDARHNEINRQLARHDFNRWFNNRWWGAPGWGALSAWGAWGWGEPYAYNYGDDVYYDGNTVYSDGEPIATSDEYAQQASDIAESGAYADTTNGDWMSLGVFALSMDGEAKGPEPTTFVQLAVSKDGVIAGTYVNSTDDTKQNIEGSVDRKSQRAAWTLAGQKWPVYEAGIYNLTEKTAPILVHYADGQTQQRLLVRVDKPEGGEKADASASAAADTQ